MRKALTAAAAAVALLAAGCSSNSTPSNSAASPAPASASTQAAASPKAAAVTADQALAALGKTITSLQPGPVVTADNDPNHLLGRPGQYTSKVAFTDSRIKSADAEGFKPGDVELGGSIEAFATTEDAKKRADYVSAIAKSASMFNEYDYLHGTVLIRVSHLLTPDQAAEYDKAGAALG